MTAPSPSPDLDPADVVLAQDFCGIRLEVPVLAAAMDAVADVHLSGELARLGGLSIRDVAGLSVAAAQLFFYVYAAAMGLSLAFIFAVYTQTSIAQTFLVTAIAFAGLSLYGYTTKRDLSAFGTFLMMGMIGLVVASLVNLFLASSALAFAISAIGVLLFAGLTAFDTQTIKTTYLQHAQMGDQDWLAKSAIMGALQLYLDFINMFMFLLQFLGNRE